MEKSVKSSSINRGLILGGILSLITVLGYSLYPEMYTNWWILIAMVIFIIAYSIASSVKSRKLLGGFISFKEAFTSYLITVAIGTIISAIVSILIFVVIDPEAAIAIKEQTIEMTVGMMERFGTPQEVIEESIAELEKENALGLTPQIFAWFKGMLFYIIIGLLASLAVKKKEPLY